jgi:hypothetical protein
MRPDVYLMVLRYDTKDFKESARRSLKQADAIVALNPDSVPPPWEGVPDILTDIPQFVTTDLRVIPAGLIDFVKSRLLTENLP